jgi:hypothetical protein
MMQGNVRAAGASTEYVIVRDPFMMPFVAKTICPARGELACKENLCHFSRTLSRRWSGHTCHQWGENRIGSSTLIVGKMFGAHGYNRDAGLAGTVPSPGGFSTGCLSRSDLVMVAMGFSPWSGPQKGRGVAERRLNHRPGASHIAGGGGRSGVAPRRKGLPAFPFRGLKPHGYRHQVALRQIPNHPLETSRNHWRLSSVG